MVSPFEELGLQPQFVQAVEKMGYDQPTPIQLAAIPALLGGRNVLGQAQTGTGKTAAFALPLLQQIQPGSKAPQALILAPTRELAIQVAEATGKLAGESALRVLAVYGGQAYRIQTRQLERGVDVVVGTPGRLLDLIRQKYLDLSQVRYLVLDEADEMLEMGFIEDVETILKEVPEERQIALFSATLPPAIRKLADHYLSDPQQITINPSCMTVAETEQRFCMVHEEKKQTALTRILEVEEVGSALIFARTKARTQELSDELNRRGLPAGALHGDLNQDRREAILNRFRQHSITLLVATDVAARGLDIENVSHVINYDVPNDPEDYVHRIGRTGRAGRKGIAITLLTPRERRRLKMIEGYTKTKIVEQSAPTREQVLANRDQRFLQRISDQMAKKSDTSRERAILAQLSENNIDLAEIALAAIRLARATESAIPAEEIALPAFEPSSSRARREAEKHADIRPYTDNKKAGKGMPQPVYKNEPFDPFKKSKASPLLRWDKRQQTGMVRLKMNLGNAHGLRPSDVVGAIASEVGIPGRAIGEIEIKRTHTFVEISENHVRQVLAESTGQYQLHGKPVLLKLAS
jgi:ATP-dependent RNA helicase DeaD